MESWSTLLEESSLISLISLAKECSWSLEVVGSQECVENPLVESSNPSVWVVGTEYVIN